MAEASVNVAFLQGSLDVLVLKTVSWKPMHGFGIARWIQQCTGDVLRLEEGTLLGGTGLVLAVIGIYGVVAYLAAQRTHEIGVRVALGASAADVIGGIVRQGLVLTAAGILLGVAGASLVTGALARLLYGVSTHDPATFAGVALLLAAVATVASLVPARRASRVDPLTALRSS